jgi:hypothetical protein
MLLETLALGSVLYVGFKSFKKQSNAEKKNFSTNTTMKSVLEDQFTQIVEESDGKKSSSSDLTFEETNKREIISASLALTLASIGTWLYWPLGLFSIPLVIYLCEQIIP